MPESEEQTHKSVFTNAPGFQSVYVNNVNISMSFQDLALTFGEIFGLDEQGILQIQNKSRVVMSPQQAKIFTMILSRNLADYEKRFGEIKLPAVVAEAEELKIPVAAPTEKS